jgi:predicted phosphodiesterase
MQDLLLDGVLHFAIGKKHSDTSKCLYLQHPDYTFSEKPRLDLPVRDADCIRVIIISDTHERHSELGPLPPCDLLIHCGDILMVNKFFSRKAAMKKLLHFNAWLGSCHAKECLVLGGNHDHLLEHLGKEEVQTILSNGKYLENESHSVGDLLLWGTPLSKGRSYNKAFQSREFYMRTLKEKPAEVDILITHGHCKEIVSNVKHKIHIWGHNHNSYGIRYAGDTLTTRKGKLYPIQSLSICAPIMDGKFRLSNLPIIIDIPRDRNRLCNIPNAHKSNQYTDTETGVRLKEQLVKPQVLYQSSVFSRFLLLFTASSSRYNHSAVHNSYRTTDKILPIESENAELI